MKIETNKITSKYYVDYAYFINSKDARGDEMWYWGSYHDQEPLDDVAYWTLPELPKE